MKPPATIVKAAIARIEARHKKARPPAEHAKAPPETIAQTTRQTVQPTARTQTAEPTPLEAIAQTARRVAEELATYFLKFEAPDDPHELPDDKWIDVRPAAPTPAPVVCCNPKLGNPNQFWPSGLDCRDIDPDDPFGPSSWRIRNTFLGTPFLEPTAMQGLQHHRRARSCPAGGS